MSRTGARRDVSLQGRLSSRCWSRWALSFLLCSLLPSLAAADSARQVTSGIGHACALTPDGGLRCWGNNGFGQLGDGSTINRSTPVDVVGLAGEVLDVGTGRYYSCALTADGLVECWGNNTYGQLGDGSATSRSTPMAVTGLTSGVTALGVGRTHACAVTVTGTVKCWGDNAFGQLGDGTTNGSPTPVNVSGLTNVVGIAAGGYHTCAVTSAGAARCWGYDAFGQLGDGATVNQLTPVTVSGLAGGAAAMALGGYSTCALTTSGAALCWGNNSSGQLGDGSVGGQRTTPAAVSGLSSGVAAISAGIYHACAVLGSGALRCWGDNSSGQLGDGTTTPRATPVNVSGFASGVAAAAGGQDHTCALEADGGLKCWGANGFGQIGDGTTTARPTAVDVLGLTGGDTLPLPGARQVATSGYHACAVTNAGGVECWGANAYGQLGDNTTTARTAPVPVHGLARGVAAVTTGAFFSCALTTAGGAKCWGRNDAGQLGDGTTVGRGTPADVLGLTSGVVAVAAGWTHACALTAAGGVKCWGANADGQVGDNTSVARPAPTNVMTLTTGVAAISAGGYHTCAVTSAGGMKCWGRNAFGQLGNGTTSTSLTPVWVSGLSTGVGTAAGGGYFTCAVTTGGAVKCWGLNTSGELGDGTNTQQSTPVDVSGLASGVAAVTAGDAHACARLTDGALRCWGSNYHGQLGTPGLARPTPMAVTGLATGATSVAAGIDATCAITVRGGVECWGYNANGQVGDGSTTDRAAPQWTRGFVPGTGTVAAGQLSACRVTAAGGAQCWGYNASGQLGDGTTTARAVPVDVTGLTSGVAGVAAGSWFACALTTAGGVKCWGHNEFGELGDGTTTSRLTPADVTGLTSGVVAIAAGSFSACALMASGGVRCWGGGAYGVLGDGAEANRLTPVWVLGQTTGMTAVTAGLGHTCGLTRGGGVKCWGRNLSGELGDGTTTNRPAAAFVTGLAAGAAGVASSGGSTFTCTILAAGGLQCWGSNSYGQLGDATTAERHTPVNVVGLASGVTAVSMGTSHTCATVVGGAKCWGWNIYGQLGDGTAVNRLTPADVTGLTAGIGAVAANGQRSFAVTVAGTIRAWGQNGSGMLGDGTTVDRSKAVAVRGFKQHDDYDADSKADVAVYRPSTGTWFSLDSSTGNASYQYRGWGVQASGDVPVSGCDFDGDGIVDPTVFRPSTGSWFILESSASYTTWDYFGWGTTGDTPVPADYDGDGITDAAVYRAATGTWYVRPSGGGTQWHVVFGNPTDVPIPGYYTANGRADIAVYRPSTGTWFVLTSASNYTSYWYKGWGVQASGDAPAPGDYDGDGRMDLCVFRATTGTWFILESHAGYTTWNYYGWGASGDTLVPGDYDGDGITDVAVYRPSTYTWYIRPSSGAAQWSKVFGQSGDVPLVTIR